MTILEKLCENENIGEPMEYASEYCPFDAEIGEQPDYCPMINVDTVAWTKDASRACVKCWLRECDENE